uniref:Cystatin domain-containing protein n=1 Tax=Ailuropoda melanoleuca TaxID=9646 RepID=A0A7N5KPT0_AILME
MALLRWLLVCSIILLSCICKQALLDIPIGGRRDASPNDPGVHQALQFAMNEYNRGSNDAFSSRVSEVVRVRTQIVSGLKYYLNVKIGRTVCRKERKEVTDLENCAFHEQPKLAKTMTCNFVVYSIPWMNSISLTSNECT